MESVGARKRRRTEAGLAYDETMKKSRSSSGIPRCSQESTLLLLTNENKPTPASQTSKEIITGDNERVESTEVILYLLMMVIIPMDPT